MMRHLPLMLLYVAAVSAEPPDAVDPGATLYAQHCAACHDAADHPAPARERLEAMPLSRIAMSMEFGKMQPQAAQLSPQQRRLLANWLASADDEARDAWITARACSAAAPEPVVGSEQNWGFGSDNARLIDAGVAIDAGNVHRLELAWALAVPQATDMRSQPVVAGPLLFLGTQNGNLLALDRETGCVYWRYAAASTIRSGLSLARDPDGQPLLFFADDIGHVYAIEADSGAERWRVSHKPFPTSVVSGSPSYHDGRLYLPVSSFEVAAAGMPSWECCRSHGAVIALDVRDGSRLWLHGTTPEARRTGESAAGVPSWGPSGASVWSTPTIDAERGVLYVGTGQNFSPPATSTSDAVLALDLETGARRWHFQALAGDVWNAACQLGGPNCPPAPGPDWDIGASVVLAERPDGRDVLLVGQKSGEVIALDPDRSGQLLWRRRLSQGTANGGNSGVHWGMASDGKAVYVPISDPDWQVEGYTPRPGIYALQVTDGSPLWSHPVQRGCAFDYRLAPRAGLAEMRQGSSAAASPWAECSYFFAHSAAAVLANGLVYAGALDGRLRILDAADGRLLRLLETARPVQGINGVDGHGGAIDVGGVVPDGRDLFVLSGYSMFGQMPGNLLLVYRLPEPSLSVR